MKTHYLKRFIFLFLLFFIFKSFGISQNSMNSLNNGKSLDTPISFYNGTSSYAIPLATVIDGALSTNISIGYQTGGIKVSDPASYVGLGWSLNIGGHLSRNINGLPDDSQYGYYHNGANLTNSDDNDIINGAKDAEPDIFSFTAGNYSGKFYFNKDKFCVLIPKTDVKIIPTISGYNFTAFKIIIPDGTTYHFNYAESMRAYDPIDPNINTPYNTIGWHLYKIESFDKKDRIIYHYSDVSSYTGNITNTETAKEHYVKALSVPNTFVYSTPQPFKFQFLQPYLDSIVGTFNKIAFTGSVRLDSGDPSNITKSIDCITYSTGSGADYDCIKYVLNQSYFKSSSSPTSYLDYTLKLDKVTKKSCDETIIEPSYDFTYYGSLNSPDNSSFFPKKTSKNIDHWGYYNYNGVTDNDAIPSMVPQTTVNGVTFGSANREPNLEGAKTAVLKNIKIPTGGTIDYEYELNTYNEDIISTGFDIQTTLISSCTFSSPTRQAVLINQNVQETGNLELTLIKNGCTTTNSDYAAIEIYATSTSTTPLQTYSINYSPTSHSIIIEINELNLTLNQTYFFTVKSYLSIGKLKFTYTNSVSNVQKNAGGLRVSKITISNGDINEDIVQTIKYFDNNDSTKSSGKLLSKPVYGFEVYNSQLGITEKLFKSGIIKTLYGFEGSIVGYKNVTVRYNGNGYEKKYFNYKVNPSSDEDKFYDIPNNYFSSQGELLSDEVYNSQNKLLIQNTNNKNIESIQYNLGFVKNGRQIVFLNGSNLRLTKYYRIRGGIYRLKSNTTIKDTVSLTTTYTYGSSTTVNPTRIEYIDTEGDKNILETEYTSNYVHFNATTTVRDTFNKRNFNIPYKVTKKYVKQGTSTEITIDRLTTFYQFYDNTGNSTTNGSAVLGPKPHYEEKYNYTWDINGTAQTATSRTLKTYNLYDPTNGKIKKETSAGYNPVFYEYNNKRLVLKRFNSYKTQYIFKNNSILLFRKIEPDGLETEYTYDKLIRMKSEKDVCLNILKEYQYVYRDNEPDYTYTKSTIPTSTYSDINIIETFDYLDKLGRPVQSVKKQHSPDILANRKDLINAVKYDKWGRKIKEYEVQKSSFSDGRFVQPLDGTWNGSLTEYEQSPLNRVKQITPLGWYSTKTSYGYNKTGDNVYNYYTTSTSDYFAIGKLNKVIEEDPNGDKLIVFYDNQGLKILERRTDNTDTPTKRKDTYFTYDGKNQLYNVMPPYTGSVNFTDDRYRYEYDGEGKITRKWIPDIGMHIYKYNSKDKLATFQDPLLTAASKYIAYSYDNFGRLIKDGIKLTNPSDLNNITFGASDTVLYETIYFTDTTGIKTGKVSQTKSKILDNTTTNYIISDMVYTTCGRTHKIVQNNHVNALKEDSIIFTYDALGNITNNVSYTKYGSQIQYVGTTQLYDHVGRNVENQFQTSAISIAKTLNKLIYNHRDELTIKYQGTYGTVGNQFYQEINYTYNLAGLLDQINQPQYGTLVYYNNCTTFPSSTAYSTYNDKDLFYLKFHYDTPISGTSVQPRKNGTFSGIRWQLKGRAFQNYAYTYDHLNQVTESKYCDYNHGPNTLTNTDRYTERFKYNIRGNITELIRFAPNPSDPCSGGFKVDSLIYRYKSAVMSNKLDSISEKALAANYNYVGFKHKPNAAYTYDVNGNITRDLYKDISSITYNLLNNPVEIKKTNNSKVKFLYDAEGNMLSASYFNASGGLDYKRDYLGDITYINGTIEAINHVEGRYVNYSGTFKHEYVLKDHLGNTRVVYTDYNNDGVIQVNTDEILQENHYYTYGMDMYGKYFQKSGYNYRYKYNGIERVSDYNVGLDIAFFRSHDPITCRWLQVDPKAEYMYGMSPYTAMNNNPVYFNDPDGDIAPIVFIAAAVIGAGTNVYNNWDKIVKDPISGIGYGLAGAAGGAVSVVNPALGATIAAAGNVATDLATGNIPDLSKGENLIDYGTSTLFNAIDVGGSGKLAKTGLKGLSDLGINLAEAQNGTAEWVLAGGDFVPDCRECETGYFEYALSVNSFSYKQSNSAIAVKAANIGLNIHGNNVNSPKPSGYYEIEYESGKKYHGVGDEKRMNQSANEKAMKHNDVVKSKNYTPTSNRRDAYILEQRGIEASGGRIKDGGNTYNKNHSPGRKILLKLLKR